MNSTNSIKRAVAIITLMAFVLATGCVTVSDEASRPKREAIVPSLIVVEPDSTKPPKHQALETGQPAPADGVWFDKDSAKCILEERAAYLGLKKKVLIQNEIVKAYVEQLNLAYEAIDLQAEANRELRKEIESQRKWSTIKNWASILGAAAALGLGIWAGK